jgi:hypothetical protein
VIDEFLDELAATLDALGVHDRSAHRVLAEARDHLEQAASEGHDAAIDRFGDVDEIGRMIAAELATSGTRAATYWVFGALALVGLAFVGLLALVPAAGGWPDIFAGRFSAVGPLLGIALFVLPQVAFVSGCLALLRAFRLRRASSVSDAELSLLRRRSAVGLAATGGAIVALALFALDFSVELARWWGWTTAAACVALTVPLAVASVRLARSASPVAPGGGSAGDVFDDLAPLFEFEPVRRLYLPAHPWRFAALSAVAVALVGIAGGWYAEGDPGSGIVRGGFEAVALLICFAVLGRTLGLRQSKR